MSKFYLIRHGKTDYTERNKKIYQGFGFHLSPLSNQGIQEIQKTSKEKRLHDAELILSSPYTRALQSAAILSKELQKEIIVETDLHEWMANKDYIYEEDEVAEQGYQEFMKYQGVYPQNQDFAWEDCNIMRERALNVLQKYTSYNTVIVVCHGMLIQSLCGVHPKNGEIIEFEI